MPIGKDGYYSLRSLLGYCESDGSPTPFLFCLSDRGRGKSVAAKLMLANMNGRSMMLYRNVADMEHAVQCWTDTLVDIGGYSAEQFKIEGGGKNGYTITVDGFPKFLFRALTQTNHCKQEFHREGIDDDGKDWTIYWVWFDEFIPLVNKKLAGVESEADCIRTIMKSIDHNTAHPRRERGVKPLRFLGYANPFTHDSEILQYFHIDLTKGYGIHRAGPGVVYELLEPFEEEHHGKMTVEQFLGDEVNRNEGWKDEMTYVIDKRPLFTSPWASMRFDKAYFSARRRGDKLYIEKNEDHINGGYVVGSIKGIKPGEKEFANTIVLETIYRNLEYGNVLFVGINTKHEFMKNLLEYK